MYKLGILTICRLEDLPIREQACNHYTLVKQKQDFYTGLDIKDMLQGCLALMYGQL